MSKKVKKDKASIKQQRSLSGVATTGRPLVGAAWRMPTEEQATAAVRVIEAAIEVYGTTVVSLVYITIVLEGKIPYAVVIGSHTLEIYVRLIALIQCILIDDFGGKLCRNTELAQRLLIVANTRWQERISAQFIFNNGHPLGTTGIAVNTTQHDLLIINRAALIS